jgi:hypothetical protein
VALVSSLAALGLGCGAPLTRFALTEPVWIDPDREPFSPRPAEWYSPALWDGADESVFRPLSDAFRLELDREAINVNSMDEVPSSSWFTNRLSRAPLTAEAVAMGACSEVDPGVGDDEVTGPWTITRGKPDGASPGFFVRDGRGVTYLMKADGGSQAERWGAADAIGAAVFWSAGYFVPCNRVVLVRAEDFVLGEGAETHYSSGHVRPLTRDVVDRILARAPALPDGRLRMGLSQFIEGRPISPWTYDGTWADDPNDVVPHEHRRDVRATFVLASWLGHIDSREQNTLTSWIEDERGGGHVRHYVLDFSDSLGALHAWDRLARRLGHSSYVDLGHVAEDFLTLGALGRPWDDAELGPAGATLGYFDVEHYVPDAWRPGYSNAAFDRMTERDAAWMARIVARFSVEDLGGLVARARLSSAEVSAELLRVLTGRRERLLERWLTRLSPLTGPVIEDGDRLCVEDLGVTSGLRPSGTRQYAARGFVGELLEERALSVETRSDGFSCVPVPRAPRATAHEPAYVLVDLVASTVGRETTHPLRVHLYDLGEGGLRVVGLERLESGDGPRR